MMTTMMINDDGLMYDMKVAAEQRFRELVSSSTIWSTGDARDTERVAIELIILDKVNELWAKLQHAVGTLISGGLYAMLEMIGGGTGSTHSVLPIREYVTCLFTCHCIRMLSPQSIIPYCYVAT